MSNKENKMIFRILKFKVIKVMIFGYIYLLSLFNGWKFISGSIEESEEDGTLPDRKTTFSKIKFRPNSADNQVTYACEASHPALRGTPTRPASPMRSSVLLSVLCKLLWTV